MSRWRRAGDPWWGPSDADLYERMMKYTIYPTQAREDWLRLVTHRRVLRRAGVGFTVAGAGAMAGMMVLFTSCPSEHDVAIGILLLVASFLTFAGAVTTP